MASGDSNKGNTNTTEFIPGVNRRAIIFYNVKLKNEDKRAMENDSQKLKTKLEELRFEVTVCANLTEDILFQQLEEFRDKEASCHFVFLLTHGTETDLMAHRQCDNHKVCAQCKECAKCKKCGQGQECAKHVEHKRMNYSIEKLLRTVSTDKNTMANIPKIVFIDACRGDEYDRGFPVDIVDGKTSKKWQLRSNFLVACATTPAYQSYANTVRGSPFIDRICNLLKERDDLMSILTKVNYEVGYIDSSKIKEKKNENTGVVTKDSFITVKQMPFITSTLTTKLYLSNSSNDQQNSKYVAQDRHGEGCTGTLSSTSVSTNIKRKIKKRTDWDKYNMEYGQKGLAVILHDHESEVICAISKYGELFQNLGGLTHKIYEIKDGLTCTLEKVRVECQDHQKYSCFVCCIIAKYPDEQPIHIPPYWEDHLKTFFTDDDCTFFVGKPKIFFMHLDEENETQNAPKGVDGTDSKAQLIIARPADILIYSVKEDCSSGLTTLDAAQVISEKLESAHGKKDVVTALTEASHCIEGKYHTTPITFSTLTGKVFL